MPEYKIEIDREKCTGDGLCCEIARNTFELDGERVSCVHKCAEGDTPEDILDAAKQCRFYAIKITDTTTGEKVYPRGSEDVKE